MKPNFALRLAHDSIELLQRSTDGWLSVGAVHLDAPDLDAGLARLREQATRLAPDGITTKLIIPDTELRYETVSAPGPDDAARRRQVEAAVDGLTPYDLGELVYDWVLEGGQALVVIAARETLAEAEEFAAAHGFNPVCSVAMPAPGTFLGEPFFGATRHAERILPKDARVLPDAEPVQVVGRARIPAAQAVPAATAPSATQSPAPSAAPPAAPTPDATDGHEPGRVTPHASLDTAPAPDAPAATTPDAQADAAEPPSGGAPVADPRRRGGFGRAALGGSGAEAARLLPSGLRRPGRQSAEAAKAAMRGGAAGLMSRLRQQLRRGPSATAPGRAGTSPSATVATPEPAGQPVGDPAGEAVTFASRRKPTPVAERDAPAAPGAKRNGATTSTDTPAAGKRRSGVARMGEALRRRLRRGERPAPVAAAAAKASAPPAPAPSAKPGAEPAAAAPRGAVPFDRAPSRPVPTEAIVPASRPPASEREKAREAEALTIFGARSAGARARGDGMRRGLVLTAGLVLLLVALGVWVAYFAPAPEQEIAATTAPVASAPADPVVAPSPAGEATATVPTQTAAAPPPADEETAAPAEDAAATLDADGRMEALVEEALRPAEPAEELAADFPGPDMADAFDPGEAATGAPTETTAVPPDRLALPAPPERPALALPELISLPPPPPFGTEMQLGDDGLVVATPDGAITPGGVTVFARPPSEVPPTRPAIVPPAIQVEPAAEGPVEDDASAADVVGPIPDDAASLPAPGPEPDAAPGTDFALADLRPLPRPDAAAPTEAGATADAELAAAPSDPEVAESELPVEAVEATRAAAPGAIALDALRPSPRPASLVAAAAVEPEPAAEPEPDLASATPQAVARSMIPSARPQDFSAAVQRALAAAARSQAEASRSAAAVQPQPAAPAPAAQPPAPQQQAAQPQPAQPQAQTAQPRIPTAASVADTATTRRAINLRQVNLIGVFGAQSNRRALVRMPNGQVVRVQVGDSLDGGRVSAIGDGELRYVRGGRNQILRVGQSG